MGNPPLFISLRSSAGCELTLGRDLDVGIRAVNAAGLVDRSSLFYLMHNA